MRCVGLIPSSSLLFSDVNHEMDCRTAWSVQPVMYQGTLFTRASKKTYPTFFLVYIFLAFFFGFFVFHSKLIVAGFIPYKEEELRESAFFFSFLFFFFLASKQGIS